MDLNSAKVLVDVPCGEGEFAKFIKKSHPQLKVIGADKFSKALNLDQFYQSGAQSFLKENCPEGIDVVTCISGVMCFDGLDELFFQFSRVLKPGGILVVTNDNILTIRDRLSFLCFGYFKRFKPLYNTFEGNWNVVLPQGIIMQMERNGFRDIKLTPTSFYFEDYLFLPLAFIFYPVTLLGVLMKSKWNLKKVIEQYPFSLLIARHYVISAKKS